MTTDEHGLSWRKSSFSGSQENCVEVAAERAGVHLRDSKNPGADTLSFATANPATFVRAIARSRRAFSA